MQHLRNKLPLDICQERTLPPPWRASRTWEAPALPGRAEQVQVIGTKFVLYRETRRKDKRDKIVLVKAKRKV